jgi:alpha-ribazole phosphatase
VCYGQTDLPVADSFIAEAVAVRRKLPAPDGIVVYSSPLQRCRQLAEALDAGPIRQDRRLLEMHFGDWEQQHWAEIADAHLPIWMADFINQRCTGGESFRDVVARVTAFWQALEQQPDKQVWVVTHAGVIRAILAYVLDISLRNAMRIAIDLGSVTCIGRTASGPQIQYINR